MSSFLCLSSSFLFPFCSICLFSPCLPSVSSPLIYFLLSFCVFFALCLFSGVSFLSFLSLCLLPASLSFVYLFFVSISSILSSLSVPVSCLSLVYLLFLLSVPLICFFFPFSSTYLFFPCSLLSVPCQSIFFSLYMGFSFVYLTSLSLHLLFIFLITISSLFMRILCLYFSSSFSVLCLYSTCLPSIVTCFTFVSLLFISGRYIFFFGQFPHFSSFHFVFLFSVSPSCVSLFCLSLLY